MGLRFQVGWKKLSMRKISISLKFIFRSLKKLAKQIVSAPDCYHVGGKLLPNGLDVHY